MNTQAAVAAVGGYTADDIVKKYIELRELVQREKKAFAERIKVYTDGMEALENAAAFLMAQTRQTALPTESGTAYRELVTSVTCQDKDAYHDWVFADILKRKQFLTGHISKEAVELWMENNEGIIPPFVKLDSHFAVRFRQR